MIFEIENIYQPVKKTHSVKVCRPSSQITNELHRNAYTLYTFILFNRLLSSNWLIKPTLLINIVEYVYVGKPFTSTMRFRSYRIASEKFTNILNTLFTREIKLFVFLSTSNHFIN